jgi:hypothetical protein
MTPSDPPFSLGAPPEPSELVPPVRNASSVGSGATAFAEQPQSAMKLSVAAIPANARVYVDICALTRV